MSFRKNLNSWGRDFECWKGKLHFEEYIIFLVHEQPHLSLSYVKTMAWGIQQAFYKHQDGNEQMSANQLILNLQMADFLWRLEKLQAHGIFLLLCSAVQIHSWSAKALERIQRKKVIRSRKHDLPRKELGLFKFREDLMWEDNHFQIRKR